MKKSSWEWWVRNLLHIETLFIIGVIVAIIYFVWFSNEDVDVSDINNAFKNFSRSGTGVGSKPKKEKKVNQHEERCREIFQNIFRAKFKSVRPDWLKNPVTNSNLELDGFNANIPTKLGKGLAFEYDGVQHAEYNKHFHRKGPEEFVYQTKKDSWKDKRCKEMGILLIRIPHFIVFHDLERYIKQKLDKEGVRVGTSRNFYD